MNATFFAVPVQIGGKDRHLVCNLKALAEIKRTTGKNPLEGGLSGLDAEQMAAFVAALLRKTEPDVSAESLLDEIEMYQIPSIMAAVEKVISGPQASAEGKPADPPQADA